MATLGTQVDVSISEVSVAHVLGGGREGRRWWWCQLAVASMKLDKELRRMSCLAGVAIGGM